MEEMGVATLHLLTFGLISQRALSAESAHTFSTAEGASSDQLYNLNFPLVPPLFNVAHAHKWLEI